MIDPMTPREFGQVRDQPLHRVDPTELRRAADFMEACQRRRDDPAWQAEQDEKIAVAEAKFAARRIEIGLPLEQSKTVRVCG